MKYSDIQLADKSTWQQYQEVWKDGDFSAVLSTTLAKKKLTAELLNELTANIHDLQGDIISGYQQLKADRIKLLENKNPTLANGEIYFWWTNPYTFAEVDALDYTFADVDSLNITWKEVDEG